jgi:hypothetical protein
MAESSAPTTLFTTTVKEPSLFTDFTVTISGPVTVIGVPAVPMISASGSM